MSNTYDLSALKADLEQEYAPVKIAVGDDDVIVLRALLRIGKADRAIAQKAIAAMDTGKTEGFELTDFDNVEDAIDQIFIAVAADGRGKELVELLEGDVMLKQMLFNKYIQHTSPGEASASPS